MSQSDIEAIERQYRELDDRHLPLYQFVMAYNDFIYALHDYGEHNLLTMIEVHTLTMIADTPGITVTELAAFWHKTKSAISQLVSRLDAQGLVTKQRREDNGRIVGLFPTELGKRLSLEHKRFDIEDITRTNDDLLRECTQEEIDTFYKVLGVYGRLTREELDHEQGRRLTR